MSLLDPLLQGGGLTAPVAVSDLAAGTAYYVVKTNVTGDGVEWGLLTGDSLQNASVPFAKLSGATLAAVLGAGSNAGNQAITNLNRIEVGNDPAQSGQARFSPGGALAVRYGGADLTLIADGGSGRVFVGDADNTELRHICGPVGVHSFYVDATRVVSIQNVTGLGAHGYFFSGDIAGSTAVVFVGTPSTTVDGTDLGLIAGPGGLGGSTDGGTIFTQPGAANGGTDGDNEMCNAAGTVVFSYKASTDSLRVRRDVDAGGSVLVESDGDPYAGRFPFKPQINALMATTSGGGADELATAIFNIAALPDTHEYVLTVVVAAVASSGDGVASKAYQWKRHDFHVDGDTEIITALGSETEPKPPVDTSGELANGADAHLQVNSDIELSGNYGVEVSLNASSSSALTWRVFAAYSLTRIDALS